MEIPPAFEAHESEIGRLLTIDSSFRELWEDYLEIRRALDSRSSSEIRQRELQRLCADLECDVREALKSES